LNSENWNQLIADTHVALIAPDANYKVVLTNSHGSATNIIADNRAMVQGQAANVDPKYYSYEEGVFYNHDNGKTDVTESMTNYNNLAEFVFSQSGLGFILNLPFHDGMSVDGNVITSKDSFHEIVITVRYGKIAELTSNGSALNLNIVFIFGGRYVDFPLNDDVLKPL
jgi:hypothetical protein